jgi:hypothetical protein
MARLHYCCWVSGMCKLAVIMCIMVEIEMHYNAVYFNLGLTMSVIIITLCAMYFCVLIK